MQTTKETLGRKINNDPRTKKDRFQEMKKRKKKGEPKKAIRITCATGNKISKCDSGTKGGQRNIDVQKKIHNLVEEFSKQSWCEKIT